MASSMIGTSHALARVKTSLKNLLFKPSPASILSNLPVQLNPTIVSGNQRWTTWEMSVDRKDADRRLDSVVLEHLDISRPILMKLIRKKIICLHRGMFEKEKDSMAKQVVSITSGGGTRLLQGDLISIYRMRVPLKRSQNEVFKHQITNNQIQAIHNLIIYKDKEIIAINKPSGLAVHSGPDIKIHLESHLPALKMDNYPEDPRIIHRLDRMTSGVLILARTKESSVELSEMFASMKKQRIHKLYWAMVIGKPKEFYGTITSQIYQKSDESFTSLANKRANVLDDGKVAITNYKVLGTYIKRLNNRRTKISLLELNPETGRKHQLRVHCAEQLNTPIVGDQKYNKKRGHLWNKNLHLHAYRMTIHKSTFNQEKIDIQAPLPSHFVRSMTEFPIFLRKAPRFPKKLLKNQKAFK